MADKKISELTNITGANIADGDELVVVDTSASETKAITFGEFKNALDTATGFVSITGDTMTGDLALSGADITFGDNDKAIFGAGSDLQIYHDGTHSLIQDTGTGNLKIKSQNFQVLGNADNEAQIETYQNDGVYLYFNGSQKLATTSTGVDITGTLTSDGLTVDGNASLSGTSPHLTFYETDLADTNTRILMQTRKFRIGTVTDAGGSFTERLQIDHNTGDLSLYEDTGTTAKFFWDASAESLGIGTSSPSEKLDVLGGLSRFGNNTTPANESDGGAYFGKISGTAFMSSQGGVTFRTGSTERLRIDNSGRVGIGTSSPSGKLHVVDGRNEFKFVQNSDNAYAIIKAGYNTKNSILNFQNTSDAGYGRIDYDHATEYMAFSTNSAERMRIDSSGRVGVGTSSPSEVIHGNGSAVSALLLTTDTYGSGTMFKVQGDGSALIYNRENSFLRFGTNNLERMRIDSSGNVGIGESSPQGKLHLKKTDTGNSPQNPAGNQLVIENGDSSGSADIQFLSASNGYNHIFFGDAADANIGVLLYDHTNNSMQFQVNTSERMRIDSSGNLLVGKTSSATNTVGIEIDGANGVGVFTRDGNAAIEVNRKTSDGTLVNFRKDGTTVGSIGVNTDRLFIGDSSYGGIAFPAGGSGVLPAGGAGALNDNTHDLGNSSARFKDLYLSGGVYLGGTGSANKLDDYEEGTWLPGVEFTTVGSTATTANSVYTTGGYTKIGKAVTVEFNISQINLGNGTGNLRLTGLPFTPSGIPPASGKQTASSGHLVAAFTSSSYVDIIKIYGVGTYNLMASTGSGAWNNINNSNASTISPNSINGSFTYYTNS